MFKSLQHRQLNNIMYSLVWMKSLFTVSELALLRLHTALFSLQSVKNGSPNCNCLQLRAKTSDRHWAKQWVWEVVMPTKLHARRPQKVWLWGEFILSDRFAQRPLTSPHFSYIIIQVGEKAPAEAHRADQRGQPGQSPRKRPGKEVFFRKERILTAEEMSYCTSK